MPHRFTLILVLMSRKPNNHNSPTRSPRSDLELAIEPFLILMKDSNLRLSSQRAPTYHLSNEKTVTHFHRQITNAYQTLIVLEILAGTSLSYPGFVFRTGFEPVPLP